MKVRVAKVFTLHFLAAVAPPLGGLDLSWCLVRAIVAACKRNLEGIDIRNLDVVARRY